MINKKIYALIFFSFFLLPLATGSYVSAQLPETQTYQLKKQTPKALLWRYLFWLENVHSKAKANESKNTHINQHVLMSTLVCCHNVCTWRSGISHHSSSHVSSPSSCCTSYTTFLKITSTLLYMCYHNFIWLVNIIVS